jgi:hypothetical protein
LSKTTTLEAPVDYSASTFERRFSTISALDLERAVERRGSDVAAKAFNKSVKRKFQVTDLQPLYIPSRDDDIAPKVTSAEFPEPHPGDAMIIDSDKPHWTPSIRVAFAGSMTSLASHFSTGRTSSTSSASTLVESLSPRSTLTPTSGCDLYGWEEGLEQKLTLESQASSGLGISGLRSTCQICAHQQSKPKGLFWKVFPHKC